jgi:hypothetical protein
MRKVSQREGLFAKGLLMQTEGGALGACTCLFHCDLEHEEVMCETGLDYDSTHSDSPHAARQTAPPYIRQRSWLLQLHRACVSGNSFLDADLLLPGTACKNHVWSAKVKTSLATDLGLWSPCVDMPVDGIFASLHLSLPTQWLSDSNIIFSIVRFLMRCKRDLDWAVLPLQ